MSNTNVEIETAETQMKLARSAPLEFGPPAYGHVRHKMGGVDRSGDGTYEHTLYIGTWRAGSFSLPLLWTQGQAIYAASAVLRDVRW